MYQHIPETTNRFETLTNLLTDLVNCNIEGKPETKTSEYGNPRQRNFGHKENGKLRGRQVHKKDLPNKIPTLVS